MKDIVLCPATVEPKANPTLLYGTCTREEKRRSAPPKSTHGSSQRANLYLFDDFVRGGEKIRRDRDTEAACVRIDEVELGWLVDRQITRLGPA
jgi:hypothetical protein